MARSHRRGEQLRHVVAIPAVQRDVQWHAMKIDDQMVSGANAGAGNS
jgi:hypothetical protein